MTVAATIEEAFYDPHLLGAAMPDLSTWAVHLAVLKAAFGLPLSRQERRAFDRVAGGRKPPRRRVRELWVIAGRRSGKTRIAAAISVYLGAFVDYRARLSAGETGHVLALAASKAQAKAVFGYVEGFFGASPILARSVRNVTAEEIQLDGRVTLGVHPNSFRTVRGRTLVAAVFDEVSFWRDDSSATPDVETYRAVLPALATTGGMLVGISSPYRRIGLLHAKFRSHFGKDDPDVLVVKGGSLDFNPTLDKEIVAQARNDDPEAAQSEWDADFRSDLSQFLEDGLIEAAIDHGRPPELPPRPGRSHEAFIDASGGRHDAFTIAIGHAEGDRFVADVVRGRRPPFDPTSVVQEFAGLAKEYGCHEITGDNFAAEWVAKAFRDAGIRYRRAEKPKSQLYIEGLPTFSRAAISIPNHPQLIRELRLLERRTSRSGRDSVDHGPSGSDDHANSLFGVLHELAVGSRCNGPAVVSWPKFRGFV